MAHDHSHRSSSRARLLIVIPIVAVVLVAQVIGGLLTGSLALLADAGHLFSDLTGLVIAVVAIGIASRPATDRHTFGYQRTEILQTAPPRHVYNAITQGFGGMYSYGERVKPVDRWKVAAYIKALQSNPAEASEAGSHVAAPAAQKHGEPQTHTGSGAPAAK